MDRNLQNNKDNLILFSGICGAGKYSILSILYGRQYNLQNTSQSNLLGNYQIQMFSHELLSQFRQEQKIKQEQNNSIVAFIHVIDLSASDFNYRNQIDFTKKISENYKELKLNCKIHVLLHKTDLIDPRNLETVVQSYKKTINQIFSQQNIVQVSYYTSSIWNNGLYQSFSSIYQSLIPKLKEINKILQKYCKDFQFSELALLEKNTFLLVAHSNEDNQINQKYEQLSCSLKRFRIPFLEKSNQINKISFNSSKSNIIILAYFGKYVLIATSSCQDKNSGLLDYNQQKLTQYLQEYITI